MDLEVGMQVADLAFAAEDGREVRLSELWADAPVVLVFLRHFG